MSNADRDHASDGSTLPTRVIHNAFIQTKQARHQFIQAQKNNQGEEFARRQLQQAVLNYYETVREYILENLDDYWHGVAPSNGNDGIAVFGAHDSSVPVPVEEFTPEGGLTEDAAIRRELGENQEIVDVDDVNQDAGVVTLRVRTYQMGLKQLDDAFNQSTIEYQQKKGSPLGNRVIRKKKSVQLDADLLFQAARLLDQAVNEMGLGATIQTKRSRYHAATDPDDYPKPFNNARRPEP